ncbi:zinc metalloprotease [Mesorhizobium muleiense]|uniref:zinc metalloprotease n=1 Tax=Mesorhizobium muleiense TaxID=1004279 RepID=UPI001F270725|nr:zinc metalloprotease [Mesorhizobium muleiense]MCF6112222.1 zinc metalloprotease [Mesorhizobium muleiense]
MDRRKFLLGLSACACCGASRAQEISVRDRSFRSPAEFLQSGLRCGTPEPTLQARQAIGTAARIANSRGLNAGTVEIPVHFHVIHDGDHAKIAESHIDNQIEVLNGAFAPANISFSKSSVGFHDKPQWVNLEPRSHPLAPSEEPAMKSELGKDVLRSLNFYTVDCQLLGWATFPWELATDRDMDGVVIRFDSLPGVSATGPYNLGHTGSHEVGHWLGLFHTFQGGCEEPGDMVFDTPAEATPGDICELQRDSCTALSGSDPVENYMDYSIDSCMTQFSAQQISRMQALIPLFRTTLLRGATASAPASIRREILTELGIR